MGIGIVSDILVRAGHKEGYRVVFQDKKGLAIRNGGVFAQITFVNESLRRRTPSGSAHRPAPSPTARPTCSWASTSSKPPAPSTRASHSASPTASRTAAVLNLHKQPTVLTLLGDRISTPKNSATASSSQCTAEHCFARNLSDLCEQRLGSKLRQHHDAGRGLSAGPDPRLATQHRLGHQGHASGATPHELKAFNIGRKLALEPRALPHKPEPETWEQLVTNKTRILRKTRISRPCL